MYRKKIFKKILGLALCACLICAEMIPAAAAERKGVAVEEKAEQLTEESEREEEAVKENGKTPEEKKEISASPTPEASGILLEPEAAEEINIEEKGAEQEEEYIPIEVHNDSRSKKYPVGGIGKKESVELTQEKEGVETFEEELAGENPELVTEAKNSVDAGLSSNYGYYTLDANEKKVYNLLKTSAFLYHASANNGIYLDSSGSRNFYAASVIDVSQYKLTLGQMEKIYFAIEADFPELFWIDDAIAYYRNGMFITKWYVLVEPDCAQYSARKTASESIKNGMRTFLEQIDNAKAAGADDMELELLIHDMILNEVDYAYDRYHNPETAAFAHSIVGVFDDNPLTDAVCEGYAKSFQMLANYAGLESIYAVGWSGNDIEGGGHAWNLAKIDGSWYNIDLTWDDTNSSVYDGYSYDFFNLTTKEFNTEKAHDYRPDIFYGMYEVPNAVDTKADYYNYFGLNVTAANIATDDAFKNLIKNAAVSNEKRRDNLLRFEADSEDTLALFMDKITNAVLKREIFNELSGNGVKYSVERIDEYPNYLQAAVSVSRIFAENVCDGYVFGNPKTSAAVYNWTNRSIENVTGNYTMEWRGTNALVIRDSFSDEVLGMFQYTLAAPVISNISNQEYSGRGICPQVTVSVNGTVLENRKDYIVEYKNNLSIGFGKVIVKGIGNYAGKAEKSFQILPKDVNKLAAAVSSNRYTYDGKAKLPYVIVKDGEEVLVQGKDYTVSYKNNTNPGTASVVITGRGNYGGNKAVSFLIDSPKIGSINLSSIKLKSGTGKTLTFSWKKQSGVSGYEVSLYKGNRKVKVSTTAKTTYKFSKLKENNQYTFKVRAFKNVNGKKYYGKWSSKLTVKTAAKTPQGFRVTAGKKSAGTKWKRTSGVTGYEIYMSAKKKSGYKKVAAIKKSSGVKYTKRKLMSNKVYYFKMRSYTAKNKFKSYSSYTSVKQVKVK